ncbi:hypothetical protein Pcinc_009622 [Petrolisthes cinctipes]|uniref:Major facilitator superfamily (MFS) profile domain-containing protein n=1 Tax=Petrolisthes cinctipes TaxID=88211 RepID=A0AAE1GAS7_PETCI|nr:hypothetical protein Pcinc_009622 [Petrolisthes cinctipes]
MMLFMINCYINMIYAFVYFGQLFMTLTPPHWCAAPNELFDSDLNLTLEQIKELTVPKDETTGKFAKCKMYQVNFTQVVGGNMSGPDPTWPNTTCINGWTYDFSLYYPTITSQLNWVCEEDWKPSLSQSLFFVGAFMASPVLGWASDRWGRLPIIVATNVMGGAAGVASAFTNSFVAFASLRFLVGMTFDTHYTVVYILLLEYVSSEYRTIMANVPIMIFLTAGLCAMPWLALYLHDWSTFAIVIHALQFISLSFPWVVPESARWLLSKGRSKETVDIITRAAHMNKKSLTPELIRELEEFGNKQKNAKNTQATALDLLKTPVLRLRFHVLCVMWLVIILAYDGHVRNSEHIGSNVFVSFTLVGFVELPADFLTMVLVEKVGRRHTTSITLVLSGVACLVIAAIPETYTTSIMALAVTGRFLITMSINVGQQYPVEVLPTVARGTGAGLIHTLGNLTGFISPYVVYLSKIGHYLPYTILGLVSILGGSICVLLPETLNQILPDTLEDGETFFTGQGYCYNPCAGSRNEDGDRELEHHTYIDSTFQALISTAENTKRIPQEEEVRERVA